MKKLIVFIFLISCLRISAQAGLCHTDTFDLILAYETGGQFSLDDQIIKTPGFVKFTGNISLKNYQDAYFEFPDEFGSGAAFRKFKDCGAVIDIDATSEYESYLNSFVTTVYTRTNKTYAGKGETMVGTKIEMPPLEFKYKIFRVKIIAVYIGNSLKTLINIDRKSKKDPMLTELKCPQYIITNILDITAY